MRRGREYRYRRCGEVRILWKPKHAGIIVDDAQMVQVVGRIAGR